MAGAALHKPFFMGGASHLARLQNGPSSSVRLWAPHRPSCAHPAGRQRTTVTNISQLQRGQVETAPTRQSPSSTTTTSSSRLREPEPYLAYEIVQGALVRYSDVSASSKQPPTAVLIHGILGNRRNMQSFARRIVQGFPHWQVVLVDLRCHGDSAATSSQLARPHSVEAAAADVTRLLAALKLFPEVLIGHSFGGKCVLSVVHQFSRMATRLPKPVRAWVLDALPGEVRSGEMGKTDRPADLITALRRTPLPIPSRQDLIAQLEGQGFSTAVAAWAATNLTPFQGDPGKLTWGFDLEGIHEMYRSYESTQLWDVLSRRMEGLTISFVKAEYSTFRWGGGDEHRIRSLGHEVHMLPASGHWVHTDNPAGLFDILAPSFGSPPDLAMQRSGSSSSSNILSLH